MGVKLVFVLGLLSVFVHSNHATPSALIIAEYTPKFVAIATKIGITVGTQAVALSSGRDLIEKIVDTAQNSVTDQVNALNTLVLNAKKKAETQGKDITTCTKTEEKQLKKIHLYALNQCRTPFSFILLKLKLAEIAKEEATLAINVKLCILRHPLFGSKLKACFDYEIQRIEDKLKAIINSISDAVRLAQVNSINCVQKNLGDLDLKIEDVSENFTKCVKSI